MYTYTGELIGVVGVAEVTVKRLRRKMAVFAFVVITVNVNKAAKLTNICYFDDILVMGNTDKEHLQHLVEVLRCLKEGVMHFKKKCASKGPHSIQCMYMW